MSQCLKKRLKIYYVYVEFIQVQNFKFWSDVAVKFRRCKYLIELRYYKKIKILNKFLAKYFNFKLFT